MDAESITKIVLTIVGSSALFSFIQFLIQRKDKKKELDIAKVLGDFENKFIGIIQEEEKSTQDRLKKHQESSQNILDAIEQLRQNDIKITGSIEAITSSQKNISSAIMGMAHDRIVRHTDRISERGAITLKEQAALTSIYDPYKAMGGNSHAKAGYEYVMRLPVVSDEEAKNIERKYKIQELKGDFVKELHEQFEEAFQEEFKKVSNKK